MADNYDDYTKEELIKLLRERDRKPRFGLVWERKEIEHERAINNDFVALDLNPALSCGDAPFQNLIIEGDNFDALRYLRMTYSGKIKCIYIDPPYNTGNKDFVYNDHFVDKDDAYRHSKWLEFIYQRLGLARDLLAEDGIIFISIDDNQFAELKLLCDSVFTASCFKGVFVWRRRTPSAMKSDLFSSDHEYVLAYALPAFSFLGVSKSYSGYANPNGDPRGDWISDNLTVGMTKEQRPNQFFDLINPATGKSYPANPNRVWSFIPETMNRLIAEDKIIFPENTKQQPKLKRFKNELKRDTNPVSTWLADVGLNAEGSREIQSILGSQIFQYPKPRSLIEHLLKVAIPEDALILDFFAGSGTTAHAVLKLNAEDSGNRRFILVSNTEATESEPDKNLCRDVCAERVRRVIQGYRNQKGETVAGLGVNASTELSTGFAYCQTRRIAADTVFNDIEHSQIWTALQLIHSMSLSPFNAHSTIQELIIADTVILYLCKLTEQELTAVIDRLASPQNLIVYCWQPALLIQHIEDERLAVLPIPQFLIDRFSSGVQT